MFRVLIEAQCAPGPSQRPALITHDVISKLFFQNFLAADAAATYFRPNITNSTCTQTKEAAVRAAKINNAKKMSKAATKAEKNAAKKALKTKTKALSKAKAAKKPKDKAKSHTPASKSKKKKKKTSKPSKSKKKKFKSAKKATKASAQPAPVLAGTALRVSYLSSCPFGTCPHFPFSVRLLCLLEKIAYASPGERRYALC